MKRFVIVFLGLAAMAVQAENLPAYKDTSLSFEDRSVDLLERMTLEEKISQLGNAAPGIERLGIAPYDWWNECLHGVARAGYATVFPQAVGIAATFNTELMHELACVISDEARAKYRYYSEQGDYGRYKGLTYWSPNINIFRDPRWGRGQETYGEDPYLTGRMGVEFVKGLQGDDEKYLKLVATAKHFAVHSGPEPLRHHFNAVPSVRDFWETYMPAFEALVTEGKVYSVMGAYNRIDGASGSGSWKLLQNILRQKWGFEGYVVSDCGAISDIYRNHKIVNTGEEAAAVGVRHGCDLNCGGVYQSYLLSAVRQGHIDEAEIDLALYRLILAKMKLGMFDPQEMVPYAQIPADAYDKPEQSDVALRVARESIVLMKNDGLLPLDKKSVRRIAVLGPNADSLVALRGNYNGDASNPVTILDGIKAAFTGAEIYYNAVCPLVDSETMLSTYPVVSDEYVTTKDADGNTVKGFTAEYFAGTELAGDPLARRIETSIDYNFKRENPEALGEEVQDNFSIRWSGSLRAPVSGKYILGITSDDGCRLKLNGKTLIEDWTVHAAYDVVAEVELAAGSQNELIVEYFEGDRDASVRLAWRLPAPEGKREKFELSGEVLAAVKAADAVVFVGGLSPDLEGEEMRVNAEGFKGGDRTLIELPEIQEDVIRCLAETGTPLVSVMLTGSCIAFEDTDDVSNALLVGWYPGQRGGNAVADVISGEYNPAGRLPVTFYESTDELGDFEDYHLSAGKGLTYRYYQGRAAYPFGYGLSYTHFTYSNMKLSRQLLKDNETLTVNVDVKNTGKLAGDEVVQLYVSDPESDIAMPVKQLREFKRISLEAGEKKRVTFELTPIEDMRYYDPLKQAYAVEPGEFEIQLGASSADIRLKKVVMVR
jgi:beta-glucosidase